jgi:KipI family sensor histidine kinase inhibitor
VEFSDGIEMEANLRLQNLRRRLDDMRVRGIVEFVPTYRSLSIHHDPIKLPRERLEQVISGALGGLEGAAASQKRVLVMPVAYGGEFGPDMANVSEHTGLGEDEIIKRHTARDCYCYMLGFTPGFGYLGGLDETLATPRLKTPRTLIPAGSVGIAGSQTGAYSIDSPGGWQLIGRTPLKLFNPEDSENPTLIDAGDWIRFRGITKEEFEDIRAKIAGGAYSPERMTEGGGL